MSELPSTEVEQVQQHNGESEKYRHFFGELTRQAAINSVMAYIDDGSMHDRDIATAWLLHDDKALNQLLDEKYRAAKLHGALMRASTEMWAHMFIQRYKELRPARLQGLTQAEIPVV